MYTYFSLWLVDNFNQETPLYILATAGMRLVEKSKQVKKVLNYCRQDFKRLLKSDTRTYMRYQTVINLCLNFFKTMTIRPHSRHLAGYPADILDVTDGIGKLRKSYNLRKYCFCWNLHGGRISNNNKLLINYYYLYYTNKYWLSNFVILQNIHPS